MGISLAFKSADEVNHIVRTCEPALLIETTGKLKHNVLHQLAAKHSSIILAAALARCDSVAGLSMPNGEGLSPLECAVTAGLRKNTRAVLEAWPECPVRKSIEIAIRDSGKRPKAPEILRVLLDSEDGRRIMDNGELPRILGTGAFSFRPCDWYGSNHNWTNMFNSNERTYRDSPKISYEMYELFSELGAKEFLGSRYQLLCAVFTKRSLRVISLLIEAADQPDFIEKPILGSDRAYCKNSLRLNRLATCTLLHVACAVGSFQVVEYLAPRMSQAALGHRDMGGMTALHYAVTCGFFSCAEILVQHMDKATRGIRDNEGFTAFQYVKTDTVRSIFEHRKCQKGQVDDFRRLLSDNGPKRAHCE